MRCTTLLLLWCSVARAQIVNVQGAIAKPPAKNEVDGQLEGKLSWAEGNAPMFDVSGGASIVWKHDRLLSLAQARGEYGTALGVVNTNKTFEHLRERVTLSCVWRWEAFAQHVRAAGDHAVGQLPAARRRRRRGQAVQPHRAHGWLPRRLRLPAS